MSLAPMLQKYEEALAVYREVDQRYVKHFHGEEANKLKEEWEKAQQVVDNWRKELRRHIG